MFEHLWACLVQHDSYLSWVIHTDRSTWMERHQNDKLVFLAEWGHLNSTAFWAWKEESLLLHQSSISRWTAFTREKKKPVKQQTVLLILCQHKCLSDFSPKRTKYGIENCIEVYLSWLCISSFLFSFPERSQNVNIIPGQLCSGTQVSLS